MVVVVCHAPLPLIVVVLLLVVVVVLPSVSNVRSFYKVSSSQNSGRDQRGSKTLNIIVNPK